MHKKLAAKSTKIQNNSAESRCQQTHHKNTLGYIKRSMVHVQRNYRPVQKVPGNEMIG